MHSVLHFGLVYACFVHALFYHRLGAWHEPVRTTSANIRDFGAVISSWGRRIATQLNKVRSSRCSIYLECCLEPLVSLRHHTVYNRSRHPRVHGGQQWGFLSSLDNPWTHIWLSSPLFRRRLAIHCIDLSTEYLVILLWSCCLIVCDCFGTALNLVVSVWEYFLIPGLDLLRSGNYPSHSGPHIRVTSADSLLVLGLHNQHLILMHRWKERAQLGVALILIPIFWRDFDFGSRLRFTDFTVQWQILLELLLCFHMLLPLVLTLYGRFHISQRLQHVLRSQSVITVNSHLPCSLCWSCRPPSSVNCGWA